MVKMNIKFLTTTIIILLALSSIGVNVTSTKISTADNQIKQNDCNCLKDDQEESDEFEFDETPDENSPDPVLSYTNNIDPPPSWNWRSATLTGGASGNWVTDVEKQGKCNCCYAFPPIAALESALEIANKNPDLNKDLSEQYIVSCGLRDYALDLNGCQDSTTEDAIKFIKKYGAISEIYFEYTSENRTVPPSCQDKSTGWKTNKINIKNYNGISGREAIKNALIQYGPIITKIHVYQNFKDDYNGGVYTKKEGDALGYHSVLIVGYVDDTSYDTGGYWICKNSWGLGWGENGFFKIKYDFCSLGYDGYYISHMGNSPICIGRGFTDITGEYIPHSDTYSYNKETAIHMSKEDGSCNAYYDFDIGVTQIQGDLEVGLYFSDHAGSPFAGGPDLSVICGNNVKKWENIGDHDTPKWRWRKIDGSESNRYIDGNGVIHVKVHDNGDDETFVYAVGLKYTPVSSTFDRAEVSISGANIGKFGTVKPDSPKKITFKIENAGSIDSTLHFKISDPGDDWLEISPLEGTIIGNNDITITLEGTAPLTPSTEKTTKFEIYNVNDKLMDYKEVTAKITSGKGESVSKIFIENNFFKTLFQYLPQFFKYLSNPFNA
jgi:C1A family cysteine protease